MQAPLELLTFLVDCRHGDKEQEMHLIAFSEYVKAAEAFSAENPLTNSRFGFVSSEDPAVIEEARQLVALDTGKSGYIRRCAC